MQTGSSRAMRSSGEASQAVLEAVENAGREALAELRLLLGLLRRPDEEPSLRPQPSLIRGRPETPPEHHRHLRIADVIHMGPARVQPPGDTRGGIKPRHSQTRLGRLDRQRQTDVTQPDDQNVLRRHVTPA